MLLNKRGQKSDGQKSDGKTTVKDATAKMTTVKNGDGQKCDKQTATGISLLHTNYTQIDQKN